MKLLAPLLCLAISGCATVKPAKPETSIFGEPLYVDGRRVTDDQIKLALIYGPGRSMLELSKVGLIIEDEIRRQSEEKAEAEIAAKEKEKPFESPAARERALKAATARNSVVLHEKYRVSDEEFEAEYTYNVEDFKKSFPVLDIGAEICRAFRSVDWYREQLRQTMYFDHVFLPTNPADWPPTTIEAIRADKSGGDLMIPEGFESYKKRSEAAERNNGVMPREDPLLVTFLREMVRNAMFQLMTFKTQPDGIDSRLAFWADSNGDGKPEVELTIDELWDRVKETVTEVEIADTKRWFITSLAVRARLAKDGALLSDQEAKRALGELTSGFDDAATTLEEMATKTYFFPSVEAFSEYAAMREGYRRLIAAKLEPGPDGALSSALREHIEHANRVMGLGQIDCEVLLVSAMDIAHYRWKKDGWGWARKTAQELRARIDRNQKDYAARLAKASEPQSQAHEPETEKPVPEPYRFWTQLVDDHSEYWDPPPPEAHDGTQQKQSDVGYKKKGRFGPRYRNDLIAYVGETTYSAWLTGECITDHMFFEQAENAVDGPFKGPLGWYITRVNRRIPPSRPLNLSEPRHMQLLREDYVRDAFDRYTKEAVAQAEVRGWSPL